jgi:hypothetical protein
MPDSPLFINLITERLMDARTSHKKDKALLDAIIIMLAVAPPSAR